MIRTAYTCNALTLGQFNRAMLPGSGIKRQDLRKEFGQFLEVDPQTIFPLAAGRMGLYLFLKAAGIGKDDEVIVPAYTCVVVTNAVKYTGANVVYADLAPAKVNPGLAELEKAISVHTKVVVIPHNFGIVFDDIESLRKKYPQLLIVEDAAHTIASSFADGKKVGTKGDAAFFSFEFSKPLTTGLGGVLVVNNKRYLPIVEGHYASLKALPASDQVRQWFTLCAHLITSYPAWVFLKGAFMRVLRATHLLGATTAGELEGNLPSTYPSLLTHWQSRLAVEQLRNYAQVEKHIVHLVKSYREALSGVPGIVLFQEKSSVLLRFPILLPFSRNTAKGRNLIAALRKTGILPGEWFNDVVHPKGSFQYCYTKGSCKTGEAYAEKMLNLPLGIHIQISEDQMHALKVAFEQYCACDSDSD